MCIRTLPAEIVKLLVTSPVIVNRPVEWLGFDKGLVDRAIGMREGGAIGQRSRAGGGGMSRAAREVIPGVSAVPPPPADKVFVKTSPIVKAHVVLG